MRALHDLVRENRPSVNRLGKQLIDRGLVCYDWAVMPRLKMDKYVSFQFPLQEIPTQKPVSGTALSLQEIIIVGNCEKQVFLPALRGPLRLIFVGKGCH